MGQHRTRTGLQHRHVAAHLTRSARWHLGKAPGAARFETEEAALAAFQFSAGRPVIVFT